MIRVAFYIAKLGDGDIVDNLISWWTWPWNIGSISTSHVEVGFKINGWWRYFSSSSRFYNGSDRKSNGTRWINADVLFKHPGRWRVWEFDFMRSEDEMIEVANSLLGKKYDWIGIFAFITLFGYPNNKNKWYCSEAVWKVVMGWWKRRISPRRLWKELMKSIYEAREVPQCDFV